MKKTFLYIFSVLALLSCVKKPTYSNVPEISFKEFFIVDQEFGQGLLIFNYTDGDGDLGRSTSDRTINSYDVFYKVYNKNANNTFSIAFDPNTLIIDTSTGLPIQIDTIFKSYLPLVDLKGQKKGIKGDISQRAIFNPNDKQFVKVKFWILDRAGNKSNEIETQVIQFK